MSEQSRPTTNQIEDNAGFWLEGWNKGFTGFHQSDYNPAMMDYFENKDIKGKTVLVPLCGKTLDMIFLSQKGANVIGVEVVTEPVESFFKENNLQYTKNEDGIYQCHEARIKIYNKDFFKLETLGHIDFLYDRASNVALPPCMRRDKYYPTIKRLINEETKILLLTMNHDGPRDFGPPYAVSPEETKETYPDLELLSTKMNKAQERFQKAGIQKQSIMVWAN